MRGLLGVTLATLILKIMFINGITDFRYGRVTVTIHKKL